MDRQINEMQASIVNVIGEVEVLIIEDKKEEALKVLRQLKKELSDDCESDR